MHIQSCSSVYNIHCKISHFSEILHVYVELWNKDEGVSLLFTFTYLFHA